jgi:hypothetical protein
LRSDIFPSLAASGRAARATAQQMASPIQISSRPICGASIFPALAASRRAARAPAPQNGFADTERIAPFLRRPLGHAGERSIRVWPTTQLAKWEGKVCVVSSPHWCSSGRAPRS